MRKPHSQARATAAADATANASAHATAFAAISALSQAHSDACAARIYAEPNPANSLETSTLLRELLVGTAAAQSTANSNAADTAASVQDVLALVAEHAAATAQEAFTARNAEERTAAANNQSFANILSALGANAAVQADGASAANIQLAGVASAVAGLRNVMDRPSSSPPTTTKTTTSPDPVLKTATATAEQAAELAGAIPLLHASIIEVCVSMVR